jgi:general secretion pathway protein D
VVNTAFGGRAAMVSGSRLVLTGVKAEPDKMVALLNSPDVLPSNVDVAISWVGVTRSGRASRGISLITNVLSAKLGVSLGAVNTASAISLKSANFDFVINALNTAPWPRKSLESAVRRYGAG